MGCVLRNTHSNGLIIINGSNVWRLESYVCFDGEIKIKKDMYKDI